jgi:hypothetical protein
MLTDDEIEVVTITEKAIRELLNQAAFSSGSIALDPRDISELCTRLLKAEARAKALEDALRECEETLALVEYPSIVDPRYGAEVEALGERIGYGALMSSASASWRKNAGKLAGSEFVAGPCFVTIVRTLMMVRTALQEQSK